MEGALGGITLAAVLLAGLVGGSRAEAARYYVAPTAAVNGQGTADSPWTLDKANALAQPGDTVVLLDGVYRGTAIAPAHSGVEGHPITYRAARAGKAVLTEAVAQPGPFPDEDSDGPAGVYLLNRAHIMVDGVTVKDPGGRFIFAAGASFITIQNCLLENTEYPESWESCRFKRVGDHITFRHNVVRKGNDSVAITGGRFHLVEGNTFEGASHTCLVLMGVQQSVVQGNRFTNPIQKLMEVFSARKRDVGDLVLKSEHVVIEDNVFGPAPRVDKNGTDSGSGSAGIQYAGNDCILRRNVFTQCGMGMDFSLYDAGPDDPEALYCSHNRLYHNTIYDCGWPARYGSGPGVWISGGEGDITDNILANNVLYHNHAHADAHFPAETPFDVQLAFANAGNFRLLSNLLMGREKGATTVWDKARKAGFTLHRFEEQFPATAAGNLEAEPGLVDVARDDFHLRADSPCRDAGRALTAARTAGEGVTLEVEDARYFTDGFGLTEPDVLRVGGRRVAVAKVDYATNTLTLARPMAWRAGDPVTLDYAGKAPDLGAFEFGAR